MSWKAVLGMALTFVLLSSIHAFAEVVVISDKFSNAPLDNNLPTVKIKMESRHFTRNLLCGKIQMENNLDDYVIITEEISFSELKNCHYDRNLVSEFFVGYDSAILTSTNKEILSNKNFTVAHIWLAIAAEVPVNGQIVNNPYKTWSQIDNQLPNIPIEIFIPPPTDNIRSMIDKTVIITGCMKSGKIQNSNTQSCTKLRNDGIVSESGETDHISYENSISITDYKSYKQSKFNYSKLGNIALDGVHPSPETIAEAKYPAILPIYAYIKRNPISPSSLNDALSALGRATSPNGRLEQLNMMIAPRPDDKCDPPKPRCPKDGNCPQSMRPPVLHCCPKNGNCPQ